MEDKTILGIGLILIGAVIISIDLFLFGYSMMGIVTIGQAGLTINLAPVIIGVLFWFIGVAIFGAGFLICLIRFIMWVIE